MSTLKIDHLIYAVPDLETGVDALERLLGVRAVFGGQHLGVGTHNALLSLGDDRYLEIIAPDPAQPEPELPRPFEVDGLKIARLATWAVKAPNIDETVKQAQEQGCDPGVVHSGGRKREDGVQLYWRNTRSEGKMPASGLLPFLIDWGTTPHPAASAPIGCSLLSLRGLHPQPEKVQQMLAALGVELGVEKGEMPALIATIQTPRGTIELQ